MPHTMLCITSPCLLLFLMTLNQCSFVSSFYQWGEQNLQRLRNKSKGTQPVYGSSRARVQVHLTDLSVQPRSYTASACLLSWEQKHSVAWGSTMIISFSLMDLNNIPYSFVRAVGVLLHFLSRLSTKCYSLKEACIKHKPPRTLAERPSGEHVVCPGPEEQSRHCGSPLISEAPGLSRYTVWLLGDWGGCSPGSAKSQAQREGSDNQQPFFWSPSSSTSRQVCSLSKVHQAILFQLSEGHLCGWTPHIQNQRL